MKEAQGFSGYQDFNEKPLLEYVLFDDFVTSTDFFFVDLFVLLTDDIHGSDEITFVRPFSAGIRDRFNVLIYRCVSNQIQIYHCLQTRESTLYRSSFITMTSDRCSY